MNMPGFTAKDSLYKITNSYFVANTRGRLNSDIKEITTAAINIGLGFEMPSKACRLACQCCDKFDNDNCCTTCLRCIVRDDGLPPAPEVVYK